LVDKQEGKWLKHIIPSQLIILARVLDMVLHMEVRVLDMVRVRVLEVAALAVLEAEAEVVAALAVLEAEAEVVAALAVLEAEAVEAEAVEDLVFMEEEDRNALVKFRKVVGVEVRVDAIVVVVVATCPCR
jgi:hypothetical protein